MEIPDRFAGCVDLLHAQASESTDLHDFGDAAYRDALQVLLDSYDATAQLSELGRISAWMMMRNSLRGRLVAVEGIRRHAADLPATVRRPLFIVGLPRTGTTILHRLLASHPDNQALEYWLSSFPQPRPAADSWALNADFQEVRQSLEMLDRVNPELKKIHEMSAEGADECRMLLMQSFVNVTFQSNANLADYEAWLYDADLRPAYKLYRDSLRLIAANEPHKRWVLKDPSHLWSMDVLLEFFPDAMVIQTHRDPVKLIPSVSSLVLTARRMQEPDVTAAEVGRRELAQWQRVWNKTIAVRRQYPQRFIDVYFDDFVNDPVAVVKTIYEQCGEELGAPHEVSMRNWMQSNPASKYGGHSYSAEEFGLSEGGIRDAFGEYCDFFDV